MLNGSGSCWFSAIYIHRLVYLTSTVMEVAAELVGNVHSNSNVLFPVESQITSLAVPSDCFQLFKSLVPLLVTLKLGKSPISF